MNPTVLTMAWAATVGAGAFLFRPRARLDAKDSKESKESKVFRMGGVALSAPAALALAVTILRWPWAAPILGVAALAAAAAAARRERRDLDRRVSAELPEVIDLLRTCTEGGLTVRLAIETVTGLLEGEIAASLGAAGRAAEAGASLADSIEHATGPLGPEVRPLVSVLTASERYGVAVVPSLDRLAAAARAEERRRGEVAARKVPVRLLFPLVLCILPAFALLTVAPLIAGGLESLSLD